MCLSEIAGNYFTVIVVVVIKIRYSVPILHASGMHTFQSWPFLQGGAGSSARERREKTPLEVFRYLYHVTRNFYSNFHGWDCLSKHFTEISLITASLFMQIAERDGKSRHKYRKHLYFVCLPLISLDIDSMMPFEIYFFCVGAYHPTF